MYLKRKIDAYLSDWKNSENRKPLIVKGQRQIGKRNQSKKLQRIIIKVWLKSIL